MARRKDVEGQQSLGLEKGMVLSRDISGNKQARRLIALYKEAEKDIARKLLEMNGSTANARLMATQKKAIDAILKALRKKGTTIAQAMVEASYRGGFRSGRDELIQAGLVDGEVRPRMGSVHTKAMEVYSSQVLSRLSDVNTTAGRTVQDIYDQLQLNTVLSGALAGTETLTQVQRKMERLAADGGVTAFVDKSGRAWSMATYTEMLARTTTMQVYNKAKEIEFREHDEDLILVSTHYPTCDMCAPWNGAVLSLTGKTEGYATLQEAESDGLFHPNCRHSFSLYLDTSFDAQWQGLDEVGAELLAQDGFVYSGGISRRRDISEEELYEARREHGEKYYAAIRSAGEKVFVDKISKNTGLSKNFVRAVYKHVFVNEHNFKHRERGLFDSSYEMSVSFQRLLQKGSYHACDIVLLRHEHIEYCLERRYNFIYDDAHDLINPKYDYRTAFWEDRKNGSAKVRKRNR